jgi:methionyl-tRNA formyltransferase
MRLLFLTNNEACLELALWLRPRVESLTISGDRLTPEAVEQHDLVVSFGYRQIIRAPELEIRRCINLHISFLPFNRGADPNVWAHLEGTPSGVSVHEIDAGIDTGPILAQRPFEFNEAETLRGTYARLHSGVQELFRENWPAIRDGSLVARRQVGEGTCHRKRQFLEVRERLLGPEGWDVPISRLKERWRQIGDKRGVQAPDA